VCVFELSLSPETPGLLLQFDVALDIHGCTGHRIAEGVRKAAVQAVCGPFRSNQLACCDSPTACHIKLLQPLVDSKADVVYGSRFQVAGERRKGDASHFALLGQPRYLSGCGSTDSQRRPGDTGQRTIGKRGPLR
jgi:hypothetical protein